ncbi:MAG: T9SS type A sorting domain-containing protein [Chitinophagaceae bacterium]|nr:T9SS type A sorting domain-containing protein [Chitinophagaceae bacterium]
MKKLAFVFLSLSLTFSLKAQTLSTIENPDVIQGVLIKITPPLTEFVPNPAWIDEVVRDENGVIGRDEDNREHRNGGHPAVDPTALPQGKDPVLQDYFYSKKRISTIGQNFNGQGNTGVNPADPSLCVGPNHIIQMINGSSGARWAIYNKTGGVVQAAGYMDAISGVPGLGDPIAMYDQFADRFVITEFASSGNHLIIMISQTNNPTGSWYVYDFTTPEFPDYPKYGIWPNAYICTSNESTNKVYAMNRVQMLAGASVTSMLSFSIPASPSIGFQAAAPVNISGTNLPPVGTQPMIMRMVDDLWTVAADVDRLELWYLNLDFVTPANSTMNQQPDLNTAAFDTDLCGYTTLNCIRQPGTNTRLDPIREIIMNRVAYRNFNTHQSLVACHAVDQGNLAPDQAGVRWYEIRRTGLGAWSIYQQGTYAPDTNSRWMPTIGIDHSGNIGLAYNVSSKVVFPSFRFTGRKNGDPLGLMTEPEQSLIAGTAAQTSNRWGDYNDLQIDPSDDATFWVTGMYRPASGWATRIGSFNILQAPLPVTLLNFEGELKNSSTIELQWNVENESNVDRYEVERMQDDGAFVNIGKLGATPPTSAVNHYQFTDQSFNPILNKHYRLKMMDVDGKFRYSNTVIIKGHSGQQVDVYPNPIKHEQLYVRLSEELSKLSLHIQIYDLNGKQILSYAHQSPSQILTLNLAALPAGMYSLKCIDDRGVSYHTQIITKN